MKKTMPCNNFMGWPGTLGVVVTLGWEGEGVGGEGRREGDDG